MGSCCTCSFIFEVYYVMPILNCINISWEKEINMCHSLGTCKKGKSICYDYDTYNYINYEIRTSIRIIFLKSHPFNWAAMPAIFASWIPKGDRQSSSQPTQRPRDGGMIQTTWMASSILWPEVVQDRKQYVTFNSKPLGIVFAFYKFIGNKS